MRFCTVINCMDGRVQLPVINYLQKRFDAEFVDSITEAGPNRILSDNNDPVIVASLFTRLEISVNAHQSVGVAIVGHHDCAGNPVSSKEQLDHIRNAKQLLSDKYSTLDVIGLWVDENWKVHEVS